MADQNDDKLNKDEVKGRVKQAAGDLTGDDDLKEEGKVDRAVSDVKQGIDKVADKVKGFVSSDDEK